MPAITLGLLDHQDPGDDARRDRRRHRVDDLAWRDHARSRASWVNGYLVGTAIFGIILVAWSGCRFARDALPSLPLLGDDHRLDHRRHDAWPISPPARSASAIRAARRCCWRCVLASLAAWHRALGTIYGRHGAHAAGRALLLGHDHLLADPGHRARRLGGRRRRARLWRRRLGLRRGAGRARGALFLDQGQPCPAVLGRLHPDPPARARRSAISSTSRSTMAASPSAGRSPRRYWPPRSSS